MDKYGDPEMLKYEELADSEKLKPIVETVLLLSGARGAQELNQSGYTNGKIVLRILQH
jgi:hypothetical protein